MSILTSKLHVFLNIRKINPSVIYIFFFSFFFPHGNWKTNCYSTPSNPILMWARESFTSLGISSQTNPPFRKSQSKPPFLPNLGQWGRKNLFLFLCIIFQRTDLKFTCICQSLLGNKYILNVQCHFSIAIKTYQISEKQHENIFRALYMALSLMWNV